MSNTDLIAKLQSAYDRAKEWPEETPGGLAALLEIRNLVPDAILALEQADRGNE